MEKSSSWPHPEQPSRHRKLSDQLIEYARKIYVEREMEFVGNPHDGSMGLYVPNVQKGEEDAILRIYGDADALRRADFSLELQGHMPHVERYVFGASHSYLIHNQIRTKKGFETQSRSDAVSQEELAYDVEYILSGTGVERPVTSQREEQEFWQIALATGVEELERGGVDVDQHFSPQEGEDHYSRMVLGARAIWVAMQSGDHERAGLFTAGVTAEDLASYCYRRMGGNHSD